MISAGRSVLVAFGCLFYVHFTWTFLLNDKCTAPSPCVCSGDFVNCDGNSLRDVPNFQQSGKTYSTVYLHLDDNFIRYVNDSAFSNIDANASSVFHLYLNSNSIERIADNAFIGIEQNVKSLNLSSNMLASLPAALGQLTNITELYLADNPLRTLDGAVMLNLGHSLTTLALNFGSLLRWPYELHFLRLLQTLKAYDVKLHYLDASAFHGFETTLEVLYMEESQLEKIPHAVCQLTNLHQLSYIDSTPSDKYSPILEACVQKLKNTSKIVLTGNGLQKFPDVLTIFPSLRVLTLTGNNITVINADLIPANMQVGSLQLYDNQFYRIPMAVNSFPNVSFLDLHNNNIQSVEDPDLRSLRELHTLILSNNPIEYVSAHSFDNNPNLRTLNLQNTLLTKIPRAVMALPNLSYLGISGQPIECTCHMSYLKSWVSTAAGVNLEGFCEYSKEPLKTYIMQSLPVCP